MNDPRTIFFLGKPGCGKGTQAKLLSERTGWTAMSSGSQFRAIATEDTQLGRKVKDEITAGLLMPDWFAMYLYLKALFALGEQESVIFDGFGRKEPEAKLDIDSHVWLGRPMTVINLSISDETMRARIQNRSKTEVRADDAAVEKRMAEYRTYTDPALQIFRDEGLLIDIDGEQTPEKIAEDVRKALNIQ